MASGGGEPIPEGAEVLDSEGERVGSVVAAAESYIVVERGFFFPADIYVPRSAIGSVGDDGIQLTVSKAYLLDHGWEVDPAEATPDAGPSSATAS